MKVAPIIFLVLVALSASYARPPEKNCNQGPSVYCETEENARLCRKVEFCAEYNRNQSQPTIVELIPSPTATSFLNPVWVDNPEDYAK